MGRLYRLLAGCRSRLGVGAEDLERVATAGYLIGRDDESEAFTGARTSDFLDRGDREGAARAACWLGFGSGPWRDGSCIGLARRAQRTLDEGQLDCVVRGYLLIPTAIQRIVQGDAAGALAIFSQAAEIARRYGDRDLASYADHGRGRALIRSEHRPKASRCSTRRCRGDRREVSPMWRAMSTAACWRPARRVRSASCIRVDDVAFTMVRQSTRPRTVSR